jgi:hypothetical protein
MSYKQKLDELESRIKFVRFTRGFPQLLIIFGGPVDKEIELRYILSKLSADEIIIVSGITINSKQRLFNVLKEHNNKVILLSYYWAPTILENSATELLRQAIGYTLDGEKWSDISFKNESLKFKGQIIIESNRSDLNSKEILKTELLRDAEVIDFSLNEAEKKERFLFEPLYPIAFGEDFNLETSVKINALDALEKNQSFIQIEDKLRNK